ncbi:hypothetical protein KKC52_01530, partial [bacterium]|nr:hypothetical protein [bacterium]
MDDFATKSKIYPCPYHSLSLLFPFLLCVLCGLCGKKCQNENCYYDYELRWKKPDDPVEEYKREKGNFLQDMEKIKRLL